MDPTSNSKPRVSCRQPRAAGTTDTRACCGGVSRAGQAGQNGAREERPGGFQGGGGQDWSGAVTGPADLLSAKPNRRAGERWWRVGWAPGSWVDSQRQNWCPSPKARPQTGMWRGGSREGPIPPHQHSLGRTELQKQGHRPASGAATAPAGPGHQPRRRAHSKVSHCFLSCSTEPGAGAGAGAGLTSCLVFHSRSSKGSLAS